MIFIYQAAKNFYEEKDIYNEMKEKFGMIYLSSIVFWPISVTYDSNMAKGNFYAFLFNALWLSIVSLI